MDRGLLVIIIGVRTPQWRNVAPVAPTLPGGGGGGGGGRQNFELMYHTSAKLTFGGGEKIFGGTKSSRGRQKAPGGARSL